MAVVESWKISGSCQCAACEEARAEQARDRAGQAGVVAEPQGDPPGLRLTAPAIPLERKEPWQAAGPFALQLSAAALDAHLAPLVARVAALEAEHARLTELTGHLVEWATMEYESEQALDRIKAWIVNKRLEMLAEVQPVTPAEPPAPAPGAGQPYRYALPHEPADATVRSADGLTVGLVAVR